MEKVRSSKQGLLSKCGALYMHAVPFVSSSAAPLTVRSTKNLWSAFSKAGQAFALSFNVTASGVAHPCSYYVFLVILSAGDLNFPQVRQPPTTAKRRPVAQVKRFVGPAFQDSKGDPPDVVKFFSILGSMCALETYQEIALKHTYTSPENR